MKSLNLGLGLTSVALGLCASCYSALEDEDMYTSVAINNQARTPNDPPAQVATGTTPSTQPTTPAPTPTPTPTPTPGAGGMPSQPQPGNDPFEGVCDPTPIFQDTTTCGGIACHGTATDKALVYVDLADPTDLRTRLIGVEGTGTCAGQYIIDADDPDASLLITKLDDTPKCGSKMPYGALTLTADQRDCLIAWTRAAAAAANQ